MFLALLISAWARLAVALPAGQAPGDGGEETEASGRAEEPEAPEAPATPVVSPRNTTVVTASRVERDPYEQPRAVTVVSAESMARTAARTTPEALLETEGVFLQKTGHGGGAPIVRGLYGQQVLLLVDGVRMNNSTVRAGPNQFLNTVDPFLVEQVEVVRGPGSVLWGSDALGGVVSVRTYWPRYRREPEPSASVRLQGSTADLGLQGHLRAGLSLLDSAVSASVTGRDFNDLRGGAEVGLQPYTGYEEGGAALKLRQRLGPGTELYAQLQGVRQVNAPRLDRSAPGDFRRFREQFRDLLHLRLVSRGARPVRELEAELSLHRQGDVTEHFRVSRDRVDIDTSAVWTAGGRVEGDLFLDLGPLGKADLVAGADAYFDRVRGGAWRRGIRDPSEVVPHPEDARYPGVPTALSAGAFALLSGEDEQPFTFRAGARLQLGTIHLPEDPRLSILFASSSTPPPVLPAAQVRNVGLAAELGIRQRLPLGLQGVVNLGTGFRAPNVDDHLRLGAEGPGFLIPTRDLRAEQSYTAEVGLRLVQEPVRAQLFYAYTAIPGLVGNLPATVDGEAVTPDGLPYLRRANRDLAVIHSLETALELRPVPALTLAGHLAWTHGTQTRRDLTAPGQPLLTEPLARTPPLNGALRVAYEPGEHLILEAVARAAADQARLSESDRLDGRICPESRGCRGTPEWAVLHLRAGLRWSERLSMTLAAQNLLDATYRGHGSGVDEPGRSIVLGLEGHL